QPSLGGRGFAMAGAQARGEAVMATAISKPFWRNDMSPVIFLPSATATPPTPATTPSPPLHRAGRTPRGTTRKPAQAVRALAAPCPDRARGAPCSSPRAAPRTLHAADARWRVRARNTLPLSSYLAQATSVRFLQQFD